MAFTHPVDQKVITTLPNPNIRTPPPAYNNNHPVSIADTSADESDSNDEDEDLSSIHLCISTPLIITGDNNLVAFDPSQAASRISLAVVDALKQISMGGGGVPMIDEEGRPRPIKVDVSADMKIEGNKNVVGEKAVLSAVIGGGLAGKRQISIGEDACRKRERADSEPIEFEAKRARLEEEARLKEEDD